ncbi:uncharacterized protein LOC116266028 [Nymphaea colorata]|nr:uncharacterized protein LOC116266028 [Nymphaea colorata]
MASPAMIVSHSPSCFPKLESSRLPINPRRLLEYFPGLNRSNGVKGKLACPVLRHRGSRRVAAGCSSSSSAEGASSDSSGGIPPQPQAEQAGGEDLRAKIAKLGLSAVLAYGLFDGITYTTFFILAFLGYEKSTGKNPAANLKALLGIVILMWTGNNVTRPFRVAGAAALAPIIDKGLKKIQRYFNLPSLFYAFALVVSIVAVSCFTIVGLLILSRWGK